MIEKDFEELFRLWYRPLCLYALHFLNDLDYVEDIVQDCYVTLWEKKEVVKSPKSYLYSVVRNRCLDEIRKGKMSDSMEREDISVAFNFADDIALQKDSLTEARLWTAIDSLPRKCRDVFLMSKRDGLKYEEISNELGISVNTVRNQVSKALHILQTGAKNILNLLFF